MASETERKAEMPEGPAAAAVLAAGVGAFVLAALVVVVEFSAAVKKLLNWSEAVGPLSGKTGVAVLAWLVAWALLHNRYRRQDGNFGQAYTIALWLIAASIAAVMLLFPLVEL